MKRWIATTTVTALSLLGLVVSSASATTPQGLGLETVPIDCPELGTTEVLVPRGNGLVGWSGGQLGVVKSVTVEGMTFTFGVKEGLPTTTCFQNGATLVVALVPPS